MNRITLAIFCLFVCIKASASHISSADIRYEYTGTGNNYKIILTLVRSCEPNNAQLTNSAAINIASSCQASQGLQLQQTYVDTIGAYCVGLQNSCTVASSIYPGLERRIYTGYATLSPCADWKISFSLCCMSATIANLLNSGAWNIYTECNLNNLATINTSVLLPNPSPYVISTGNVNYIPLYTVDPENDSITITNFSAGAAAYAPGYTPAQPLGAGSVLNYDLVNHTLAIKTMASGRFFLSMDIVEYRNGVVVGSSRNSITIVSLASTAPLTIPTLTQNSTLHYVTCPGMLNSITLNFIDSTVTDSVFLTVTSPNLPGWTFNTTTTSTAGGASANISWLTPVTMNPATLPQFYFNIHAKDNSCPAHGSAYFAAVVQTAQCNTDSVWAGDANADYTVNIYDPLAIAVAYNKTGPVRVGASTAWQAQYCTNWTDTFTNGVNMKHADCNGNGTVDTFDLAAVYTNWGNVHVKGGGIKAKTTGVPDLYFDIAGINFYPGATVSVPIKLGNSVSPMNNMYGLASKITIGGVTLASAPTIAYPGSWIGSGSNTLKFLKSINSNNIAWAYARRDHQNISGNGTIAMLNFTIPSNAVVGSALSLDFDNSKIVNNALVDITGYNEVDTFVIVTPVGVNDINHILSSAVIVPNPSNERASLQLMLSQTASISVNIIDIAGRIVSTETRPIRKGESIIALPSNLVPGLYLVRISESGKQLEVIKWIKQ
jgi:hypothetical protein